MSRFGMARIRKSTVYETDRQPSAGITGPSEPRIAHITLPHAAFHGTRGHPSIICGVFLQMMARMVWEVVVWPGSSTLSGVDFNVQPWHISRSSS
jgi:hypothetical protein